MIDFEGIADRMQQLASPPDERVLVLSQAQIDALLKEKRQPLPWYRMLE